MYASQFQSFPDNCTCAGTHTLFMFVYTDVHTVEPLLKDASETSLIRTVSEAQ